MDKYDIAVCIPSLNEADSISHTTQTIAEGLIQYFPEMKCIIINADNQSNDNTPQIFLSIETSTIDKKVILTEKKGKGCNLVAFFKYGRENKIPFLSCLDADLKSIKPDWVQTLLTPVIRGEADLVVPVYKRNRYEGNTTNHFCFPICSAVLNNPIRQPIAGDFAFSQNLIEILLQHPMPVAANHYGIDIFMTTSAILNELKVVEVSLGEKIHNPSFGKMIPMFLEVATTLFFQLTNNADKTKLLIFTDNRNTIESFAIHDIAKKPTDEDILKRIAEAESILKGSLLNAKYLREEISTAHKALEMKSYDSNFWIDAVAKSVTIALNKRLSYEECRQLASEILGCYLARVITYFTEIEGANTQEIDGILNKQSNYLKQIITK